MKPTRYLLPFSALLFTGIAVAEPAPANSEMAVNDTFERAELGNGWHVNTGEWKIVGGVLKAREIPADKHSVFRCLGDGIEIDDLKVRPVKKS